MQKTAGAGTGLDSRAIHLADASERGVSEIRTRDADFRHFPELRVVDPLA